MNSKWYIELPIVLITLAAAIVFAFNVNFGGCNKPATNKVANNPNTGNPAASPEMAKWMEGRDLFKANCAACHNPKSDGVGPALFGVTARWKAAPEFKGKRGEEWMRIWIRNWEDVVGAGYKYGVDMANSRPAQMNIFPYLNDEQIDKILFYVEAPDLNKSASPKPGAKP